MTAAAPATGRDVGPGRPPPRGSFAGRLRGLVAVLLTANLGLGAAGLAGMAGTLEGLRTVYEDRAQPLWLLSQVRQLNTDNAWQLSRAIQQARLQDYPLSEQLETVAANRARIETLWSAYKSRRLSPEEARLASDFDAHYEAYVATVIEPTYKALDNSDLFLAQIRAFLGGYKTLGRACDDDLKALEELQETLSQQEYAAATARYARLQIGLAALVCLSLIGGGFYTRRLTRGLVAPLFAMRDAMRRIDGENDFTARVPISGGDEVGETAAAFNRLFDHLQATLRLILERSLAIDGQAVLLAEAAGHALTAAATADDSAHRMVETIAEMARAMGEMADQAGAAASLAQANGELSENGSAIILEVVAEIREIAGATNRAARSMENLDASARRISDVVLVIKEVAEQTNLLALNAAIEAARAGDQGRGFAVVADEVRKLAERTTHSTREIGEIIAAVQKGSGEAGHAMASTVARVGAGVAMAEDAGAAIEKIHGGTVESVRAGRAIAAAAARQGEASGEIDRRTRQVAEAAAHNQAAAGVAAATAGRLRHLVEEMKTAVTAFKL